MLSDEDKARIKAEEEYRAQVAAEARARTNQAPVTPAVQPPITPKRKSRIGAVVGWTLVALVTLIIIAPKGEDSENSATSEANSIEAATVAASRASEVTQPRLPAGVQEVGVWRMKVNSWRETRLLDETDNQFMTERAEDGEKFVVVNFTLENRTNETQTFSEIFDQFKLASSDGELMDQDIMPMALKNAFSGGQIPPGRKRTGDVLFNVPDTSRGFTFTLQFMGGESAEWTLSE